MTSILVTARNGACFAALRALALVTARNGACFAALRALAIAVLPLAATAATPGVQLSVPVLGYVFDPAAQTIRQASGVPGAASLDGAVTGSLKAAWVHSGARRAIVITKDSETAVVSWTSGAAQTTVLATALHGLEAASLSASGHAAVLHDGRTAEVWVDATKTASYTSDGITAAAVRDDGTAVVATSGGNLVLVTAAEARVIASGSDWKALAFAPGGADVIAASATELLRIPGVDTNPGQSLLATLAAEPTAIQVASDGSAIAVASANDVAIVKDGAVTQMGCECTLAGLARLAGNLVVSLGGALVLDADTAEPRIFTLPELTGGAQ